MDKLEKRIREALAQTLDTTEFSGLGTRETGKVRDSYKLAGKRILTPEGKDGDANGAVIKELIAHGKLLAKGTLRHSYPHSWRSKAPVIFRATPQWFVAMGKTPASYIYYKDVNREPM